MRFEQLDYLIAINQYHSMNKAAEAVYVSQQAISKAIQELEEELGVKLLIRNNKGSFLTSEALLLIQSIKEFYTICRRIKSVSKEQSKQIFLLIDTSSVTLWETSYFFFRKNYPQTELQLEYINYLELEDKLKQYPEAIAILYCNDNLYKTYKKKYVSKIIQTLPVFLYVSANSPLAKNPVISINSLHDSKILLYTSETGNSVLRELLTDYHLEERNNKYQYLITESIILNELQNSPNTVFFTPVRLHDNISENITTIKIKEKLELHLCCFCKENHIPDGLIEALM